MSLVFLKRGSSTTPTTEKTGNFILFNIKPVIYIQKVFVTLFTIFFSFVENGILNIKPTLVSDRFGDEFLEEGFLNLIPEGCNPETGKQCTM